jgi:hypothetical protein
MTLLVTAATIILKINLVAAKPLAQMASAINARLGYSYRVEPVSKQPLSVVLPRTERTALTALLDFT